MPSTGAGSQVGRSSEGTKREWAGVGRKTTHHERYGRYQIDIGHFPDASWSVCKCLVYVRRVKVSNI